VFHCLLSRDALHEWDDNPKLHDCEHYADWLDELGTFHGILDEMNLELVHKAPKPWAVTCNNHSAPVHEEVMRRTAISAEIDQRFPSLYPLAESLVECCQLEATGPTPHRFSEALSLPKEDPLRMSLAAALLRFSPKNKLEAAEISVRPFLSVTLPGDSRRLHSRPDWHGNGPRADDILVNEEAAEFCRATLIGHSRLFQIAQFFEYAGVCWFVGREYAHVGNCPLRLVPFFKLSGQRVVLPASCISQRVLIYPHSAEGVILNWYMLTGPCRFPEALREELLDATGCANPTV